MVKMILLLFAALAATSPVHAALTSSNVPVHTHASVQQGGSLGAVTVSGTLSSTKPCEPGFTRELPNFCRADSSTSITWNAATTCTAQSTGSLLPATAKSVLLTVQPRALAANAVGFRFFSVVFFNETACTNINNRVFVAAREQVADPGLNELVRSTEHLIVKLTASNTFRVTQSAATLGSVYAAYVDGYFD